MTGNALIAQVATDRFQDVEVEVSDRVAHAFRSETLNGLKLSTQRRLVSLAVIAVLLVYLVPTSRVYYYEALLGLFTYSFFKRTFHAPLPVASLAAGSSGRWLQHITRQRTALLRKALGRAPNARKCP